MVDILCNRSCSTLETGSSSFTPATRLPAELVEVVIYIVCLCTGGPLNITSLRRSYRNYVSPRSRSQILLLRLHLILADLFTIFVYTPTQIIWMITFQWHGGDLLCRICKFFYTFSFYLNSFVVSNIAVYRATAARSIRTLNASQIAIPRIRRSLIIVYTVAALFSVPQLFIFQLFQPDELIEFKQCTPIWTIYAYTYHNQISSSTIGDEEMQWYEQNSARINQYEMLYNMAHLLLVFWIPTLIIVSSYLYVIFALNALIQKEEYEMENQEPAIPRSRRCCDDVELSLCDEVPSLAKASVDNRESTRQPCIRVSITRTTIDRATRNARQQATLILTAYLMLWSPYNIIALINMFVESAEIRNTTSITLPFLNALIVMNAVVNPIIYRFCERK